MFMSDSDVSLCRFRFWFGNKLLVSVDLVRFRFSSKMSV